MMTTTTTNPPFSTSGTSSSSRCGGGSQSRGWGNSPTAASPRSASNSQNNNRNSQNNNHRRTPHPDPWDDESGIGVDRPAAGLIRPICHKNTNATNNIHICPTNTQDTNNPRTSSSSSSNCSEWTTVTPIIATTPPTTSTTIVVGYAFGRKKLSTMSAVMAAASRAMVLLPDDDDDDTVSVGDCSSSSSRRRNRPQHPSPPNHYHYHPNAENDDDDDDDDEPTRSRNPSPKQTMHPEKNNQTATNGTAIRVEFVHLDPDFPLEEQHHGGRIDVILHKLTEDILCLSQMALSSTSSSSNPDILSSRKNDDITTNNCTEGTDPHMVAVHRVNRLLDFCRDHPECSLVDNPLSVQTLMSRAEIAHTLANCLRQCRTRSGYSVRSPAYAVLAVADAADNKEATLRTIAHQVRHLSFPIIVKPLTAAGTKASHALAVVMDRSGLCHLQNQKVGLLCQEYSNHNGVLYKVYVLGNHVSVHQRQSLPNLPTPHSFGADRRNGDPSDKTAASCTVTVAPPLHCHHPKNYVEFDSQCPYPQLSDFGFTKRDSDIFVRLDDQTQPSMLVTAQEIQPVVDALKGAFGLELFGFDILIASKCNENNNNNNNNCRGAVDGGDKLQQKEMLVVDVNYFPSYKEVSNFPLLLARYLTDRAMTSRMKKVAATRAAAAGNVCMHCPPAPPPHDNSRIRSSYRK